MTFYRCKTFTTGGYSYDFNGDIVVTKTSYLSKTIDIIYNEYFLVKETSKGYWIKPVPFIKSDEEIKPIFILKNSKKRFAYPTKEEALNNLKHRTLRRIKILEEQLFDCNLILSNINKEVNGLVISK